MRIRLTLAPGSPHRLDELAHTDVQIDAPPGTRVGQVAGQLARAAGLDGFAETGLWVGSTALPTDALIGTGAVRNGAVLGVGGPGPRTKTVASLLRVQVVAGPDSGQVIDLPRGLLVIGRGADCDLRVGDCDISRRHLELTASAHGVSVRDLESRNGSVLLDINGSPPEPIDAEGTGLPVGSYVRIGETVLCVAARTSPAAAQHDDDSGGIVVNRAPRLQVRLPPRAVTFDAPVSSVLRPGLPWMAALLPAVAGAGLAWYLHNIQFLAFMLLSPVVVLGAAVGDRFGERRGQRRSRAERKRREKAHTISLAELIADETSFRRRAHPDPVAVAHTALLPDARIWERRRCDPDLLEVSVGLGDRAATVTVRQGSESRDPPTLSAVPLVAQLRTGPIGICGPRPLSIGLARWLIAQLAVQHSSADVTIVALVGAADWGSWDWMRWLPHTQAGAGATALTDDDDQRAALITELEALVERRRTSPARSGSDADQWAGPWVVVLVDRSAEHGGLAGLGQILQAGAAVGVTAICIDEDEGRLPAACASVASIGGDTGSRVRLRTARGSDETAVIQRVSRAWADRVARGLSPLRDPEDQADGRLPGAVSLLELLDTPLDANEVRAGWQSSDGVPQTVIGVGADGPIQIDLARDGPHALVAGTTGAGKSELLQTLVAGLAVHCSPTDLQFVLIDYKGGAAFAQCAQLPHTAGVVTDLDSHLTERALRSLDAEIRRREQAFATASVSDVTEYRQKRGSSVEPIGRLVLIVDEFAALADELPDFVTGLIGVAQRGRSLGLHLVLATQRPGGVVSPEIRANSALRIALRTTDPNESSDVIGTADAALIDPATPGRALLRTGSGLTEFQCARVAGSSRDGPIITVQRLTRRATSVEPVEPSPVATADDTSDLARLVATLTEAAAGRTRPPRPWLDPLPNVVGLVDLDGLAATEDGATPRKPPPVPGRFSVPFAIVDHPERQRRSVDHLELGNGGSLLVVGGPRSGRTTSIRTIVASAAERLGPEDLHVHVIDGGGGLADLSALPHCGSHLSASDGLQIDRLLNRIGIEIDARRSHLATLGVGTATDARDRGVAMPALLLVVDGWERVSAELEVIDAGRPTDTALRLIRDGGAVGLTVVLTGDRGALVPRLAAAVRRRLILPLSDVEDYLMAGLTRRQVPQHRPPGRALDPDGSERQLAVVSRSSTERADQVGYVSSLADRWPAARAGLAPLIVRPLPRRVPAKELIVVDDSSAVVLGLGGDDAGPLAVRAVGGPSPSSIGAAPGPIRFFVVGPPRSGRSTMLAAVAGQLMNRSVHLLVAASSRSPLAALAERVGVDLVGPGTARAADAVRHAETAREADRPITLFIDDCEQFTDTPIGDWLAGLVHSDDRGVAAFISGRTDDLAVSYRGLGTELRRQRTGLLLQPGPGDGELFGVRLPFTRSTSPVGRGYLVAPALLSPSRPEASDAIAIQVALP